MPRKYRAARRPHRFLLRGWLLAAAVLFALILATPYVAREVSDRTVEARLAELDSLIVKHADDAGLSSDLVRAVVRAESGGDPGALSPAGARGLMQVMPDALADARRVGGLPAGDLTDPAYNLRVGTTYLAHLMDRFDRDTRLAVAAYHMGPTRVADLRRRHASLSSDELVARFAGPRTRAYVQQVMADLPE